MARGGESGLVSCGGYSGDSLFGQYVLRRFIRPAQPSLNEKDFRSHC